MRALTIREVCERALRKIGAYAIRDAGADPDEIEEARYWLDMIIGHLASTHRLFWLIPETGQIALNKDKAEYDLLEGLGAPHAARGVMFPIMAYVRDLATKHDHSADIIRRAHFEAITTKDEEGRPDLVYIDRQRERTVFVHPVPDRDDAYQLRIVFQRFNEDMTSGRPERRHDLAENWNLWLVTALASELASGPVRKLPDGEVNQLKRDAELLKRDLIAYANAEHQSRPPVTRFVRF